MSTERSSSRSTRSLAGWIVDIVDATDHEPLARLRLRQIAGGRSAVIGLDDERVLVRFDSFGQLAVGEPDDTSDVDGFGFTSSRCVRDVIAGRLEATDAVTTGTIEIKGSPSDVTALLHIIEIVLDVASRSPQLRDLAREFTDREPPRVSQQQLRADDSLEIALLDRLGLIR